MTFLPFLIYTSIMLFGLGFIAWLSDRHK